MIDSALFFRPLIATPGFHQDASALLLEEKAVRIESDAVHLVGARPFRPDRFGNDPKHATSIETKLTCLQEFPCPRFAHRDIVAAFEGLWTHGTDPTETGNIQMAVLGGLTMLRSIILIGKVS